MKSTQVNQQLHTSTISTLLDSTRRRFKNLIQVFKVIFFV